MKKDGEKSAICMLRKWKQKAGKTFAEIEMTYNTRDPLAIETIIDETKTCGKKVKIEYERSKKIESMRSSDQLFVKQFTIDHLPSTTEREKEKECSELRLYIDCMDL